MNIVPTKREEKLLAKIVLLEKELLSERQESKNYKKELKGLHKKLDSIEEQTKDLRSKLHELKKK